jgi:hypothetical protein
VSNPEPSIRLIKLVSGLIAALMVLYYAWLLYSVFAPNWPSPPAHPGAY